MRNPEDRMAWEDFVRIYTPLVFGFCRGRGLQEADAADVSQEAMKAVAGAIGRFDYDPARGTFRSWLFRIVRSKLSNHFAAPGDRPHYGPAIHRGDAGGP
jgi:RNA polymerase sigma factor (sigma-70 family)